MYNNNSSAIAGLVAVDRISAGATSGDQIPVVRLRSIQAGRGIAAMIVLLYHNSINFGFQKYWGEDPLHGGATFGHAGVEFFFVLSGFLIFLIHRGDIGRPGRLSRYIKKRFSRIYPVYWFVLILMLAAYFYVPSYGEGWERDPFTVISSFLLVHIHTTHVVLAVSWTLFFEMMFYVVFALLIFNRTVGIVTAIGWLLVSALSGPLSLEGQIGTFYFSPANLLFAMGIVAAWQLKQRTIPFAWLALIAGICTFAGTGLTEVFNIGMQGFIRLWLYGLGSMLAILGAVELERSGRLTVSPLSVLLGEASYSIYLMHAPLLSIATKVLLLLGFRDFLPGIVSYFLIAMLVTILCVQFHVHFERPLLRYCERRLGLGSRLPQNSI